MYLRPALPFIGGAASLSPKFSELFRPAYLVFLMASGNLGGFFSGNLKVLSLDFANFSSISFLKSTSSCSIFGLMFDHILCLKWSNDRSQNHLEFHTKSDPESTHFLEDFLDFFFLEDFLDFFFDL